MEQTALENIEKRIAELEKNKQSLIAELNATIGAEIELNNLKKLLTEAHND